MNNKYTVFVFSCVANELNSCALSYLYSTIIHFLNMTIINSVQYPMILLWGVTFFDMLTVPFVCTAWLSTTLRACLMANPPNLKQI